MINGTLRDDTRAVKSAVAVADLQRRIVTPMDAGLAAQPVPEDVIVWRGTNTDQFDRIPDELLGTVQYEPGYVSTSVGTRPAFGGNVLLKIRVPKGTEAHFVMPFSHFGVERELLLRRGLQYYVHTVERKSGQWLVEVEVLPPHDQAPADQTDATGPIGMPIRRKK